MRYFLFAALFLGVGACEENPGGNPATDCQSAYQHLSQLRIDSAKFPDTLDSEKILDIKAKQHRTLMKARAGDIAKCEEKPDTKWLRCVSAATSLSQAQQCS